MQIKDRAGVVTITLHKSDVSRFLDASYLLRRIARNVSDFDLVESFTETADQLFKVVEAYGAQHLDDKGELKEVKKPDEAEAPTTKKKGG